jgi:hypothetical protein
MRAVWVQGLFSAVVPASIALIVSLLAWPVSAQNNRVTCTLQRDGAEYKGTCEIPCAVNALAINFDGQRPGFSCSAPPRRVKAMLRAQDRFDDWLGTMEGKEPEDPTRFSVIRAKVGNSGVAKLPYGWFALTDQKLENERLTLVVDADRQLPPTDNDIRILQQATALLASPEVWNRKDNRECPPNQMRLSMFCALIQATTEISGGVHYRQPALQAVREVLNDVGKSRTKLHRLMDYNNHPDTTLDDIHNLLRIAQERLQERIQ